MALISCRNVSLAYEGNTIVTGLDFNVSQGDYLCIVGENGSGKSTLMKALLGLKKVSQGNISFGDSLRKKNIGYLPQQTDVQRDFPANVREVVLSGCLSTGRFNPFYTKEDKLRADRNMELLGIKDIEKKCYRELSGGQQQRVLLARALCAADRLLILDEPAAGLDPVVTEELYSIINSLNKDHGMTIIMVSHDIGHAVSHATHILHIGNTPLFCGTKEEYLSSEAFRRISGKGGAE